MILPAIAGALLVLIVLWDAFETIVLPRRVTRRFRLARLFYRATWQPWRSIAQNFCRPKLRETFLSFFGPLSLIWLFIVWAVLLIVGFGLVFYGDTQSSRSFLASCYLSATTFFTVGIGAAPQTRFERFIDVTESGLGFGFLALVLSYLPVIYQVFSRREVNIVLLDARAGSPPSATELLRRHAGQVDALEVLLRDWERWAADILESHVSYPVVSYFRSQHNNESWLSALTAILDSCALLLAGPENPCSRQARLTFAMCRHTVVDLAQVFHAAPRIGVDRLPPEDFDRMRTSLAGSGFGLPVTPEQDAKLAKLREMYEPYVRALGNHLYMEIPRFILAREIADNWRTSAWGRISGLATPPAQDGVPDDHIDWQDVRYRRQ